MFVAAAPPTATSDTVLLLSDCDPECLCFPATLPLLPCLPALPLLLPCRPLQRPPTRESPTSTCLRPSPASHSAAGSSGTSTRHAGLQIGCCCPACGQCHPLLPCMSSAAVADDTLLLTLLCVWQKAGGQATTSDECLLPSPPAAVLQAEEGAVRAGRAVPAAAAETPHLALPRWARPPPGDFGCSS